MATSLLSSLFRRAPQLTTHPPKFPYNIKNNPYRCQKPWPPDFTQLSKKHQFRLERRYRQRTQLKWARPGWKKGVTLVQWGAILFVLVYGVLYMEVDEGGRSSTVFDGVRRVYGEQMGIFEGARDGEGVIEDGTGGQAENG